MSSKSRAIRWAVAGCASAGCAGSSPSIAGGQPDATGRAAGDEKAAAIEARQDTGSRQFAQSRANRRPAGAEDHGERAFHQHRSARQRSRGNGACERAFDDGVARVSDVVRLWFRCPFRQRLKARPGSFNRGDGRAIVRNNAFRERKSKRNEQIFAVTPVLTASLAIQRSAPNSILTFVHSSQSLMPTSGFRPMRLARHDGPRRSQQSLRRQARLVGHFADRARRRISDAAGAFRFGQVDPVAPDRGSRTARCRPRSSRRDRSDPPPAASARVGLRAAEICAFFRACRSRPMSASGCATVGSIR